MNEYQAFVTTGPKGKRGAENRRLYRDILGRTCRLFGHHEYSRPVITLACPRPDILYVHMYTWRKVCVSANICVLCID